MEKTNSIVFRDLRADEIQVRVADRKNDKVNLLIYKDARVDMDILDETVGSFGWSKDVKDVNGVTYCGIALKSPEGLWIWKWAAGGESNFEKEKGTDSDALKRSGFLWGIGRSLYTAPKIWIPDDGSKSWKVSKIAYKDGKISDLRIVNSKGQVVYDYENFEAKKVVDLGKDEDRIQALKDFCRDMMDRGEAAEKTLTAFYNFYVDKITEWQRFPNFNNLFEKWIAREY